MRNFAQLAMVGLAILLMWGGPKLQGLLTKGEAEGSVAASDPQAVSTSDSEPGRKLDGITNTLAGLDEPYEADPTCSRVRTCGNGVIDPGEECDGENLDGVSCVGLGFTGDCGGDSLCLQAGLACTDRCRFDLRGCTAARGDEPTRFVDNGDGTVTDRLTNLMWEKKCYGPGCSFDHNVRTKLDWKSAASWWLDKLNSDRRRGYAGHANWRLPTIRELRTILVEPWPCRSNPCIDDAIFGEGLTGSGPYWSGISLLHNPARGWQVNFNNGKAATEIKRTSVYVRAVRTIGDEGKPPVQQDDLAVSTDAREDPGCSWVRLCGNGLLDPSERCDGLDLDGQSCASMGFSGACSSGAHCVGQALSCSSACSFDFTGCSARSGTEPERFAEHGDGTFTDRLTGLMWERKCSGDGCPAAHAADEELAWRRAASDWIDGLNAEQGSGYAGYDDWRLPTISELRSLTLDPWPCDSVPCVEPGILGFESLQGLSLWSATTLDADKSRAWSLTPRDGAVEKSGKQVRRRVLAVRRGVRHAGAMLASR